MIRERNRVLFIILLLLTFAGQNAVASFVPCDMALEQELEHGDLALSLSLTSAQADPSSLHSQHGVKSPAAMDDAGTSMSCNCAMSQCKTTLALASVSQTFHSLTFTRYLAVNQQIIESRYFPGVFRHPISA